VSSSEGSFIPSTKTRRTISANEETNINGKLVFVALPGDLRHRSGPICVTDSGGGSAGHGNDVDALHG